MPEPIPPIALPPAQNPQQEGEWLRDALANGKTLQDYCPRCKRIMRALAYAAIIRKEKLRSVNADEG